MEPHLQRAYMREARECDLLRGGGIAAVHCCGGRAPETEEGQSEARLSIQKHSQPYISELPAQHTSI
jgi:hypothetical protein